MKKVYSSYGVRSVCKVIKLCDIRGKQEKSFRPSTTDSKHSGRIAPDLVGRRFKRLRKNEVSVSDVTYLRSSFGWIYL
ncbi:IS1236 transposase domain protein [Leptospira fainei serovar Hurstbridge str. BUT 6]|uniref:IS1236 transposase domain protein n=1 Tax=Leptospira fainei serovar Hurstbridge str. BUT 6 TaxID=1193011 RepID=S3W4G4_9LEPT|nr:IS1236 transposase domain protein [Leptospira fainei serovar Hurstbridge str. BUT 6]